MVEIPLTTGIQLLDVALLVVGFGALGLATAVANIWKMGGVFEEADKNS